MHGSTRPAARRTHVPVKAQADLSAADKERICGGNAEILFGYDKHPDRGPGGARLAGVAR